MEEPVREGDECDGADERLVDTALAACGIKVDAKLLLIMQPTADGEQSKLIKVRHLFTAFAKEIRSMAPESECLSDKQREEVDEKIEELRKRFEGRITALESQIFDRETEPEGAPSIPEAFLASPSATAQEVAENQKATKTIGKSVDELYTHLRALLERLEQVESTQPMFDHFDADLKVLYHAALDNLYDGRPFDTGTIQDYAERRQKLSTAMSGPWIKRQELQDEILRIDEQCGVLGSRAHGPSIAEVSNKLSEVEEVLRQQLNRNHEACEVALQQQKDIVERLHDDAGKLQEDFEEERIFRDDQHQRGMRRDKEVADQLRSLTSRIKPVIEQDLGRVAEEWQAHLLALRDEVQKELDKVVQDMCKVDEKVSWVQQKLQSNFWMVGQML